MRSLPKATLTLTSSEKGITRTFTTDEGGRYSFNQLPPAAYSLTIKAKGFKTYQQNGIVLDAAETATQNVTLTVGAETISVTVTSDVALLNTENANVAADIDAKQIVEMPLNVRNIYGLATLNSSVQNSSEGQLLLGGGSNTTDTADQDISFMNFAGGFFGTTAFLVDGSWDTDTEWGAVIFVPGVDAVQEFKIQNNSFTAQYGWSTGNVVNVVTKSGTHDFHGSAIRVLFQQQFQCPQLLPVTRQLPGSAQHEPLHVQPEPGWRNRPAGRCTFLACINSGTRPSSSVTTSTSMQTLQPRRSTRCQTRTSSPETSLSNCQARPRATTLWAGPSITVRFTIRAAATPLPPVNRILIIPVTNPYGTNLTATKTGYIRNPVPGNILSNITGYTPDAVGAKLLSYFLRRRSRQCGQQPDSGRQAPTYWDEYGIRADHNINDNTSAYFRYSYKEEAKTGEAANWGSDPAGQGNQRPNNRWGMWAGLTRIFSPTFTMNITSGVQIWHETSTNQSVGFNPSTTLGLPAYVNQVDPIFPTVNFGQGISQLGPNTGNTEGVTNHGPIGTVNADFIKTQGKNTINFGFMGVEQVFSQYNFFTNQLSFEGNFTTGPNPLAGAPGVSFTGNGVAQALLGVLDSGSIQQTSEHRPPLMSPTIFLASTCRTIGSRCTT